MDKECPTCGFVGQFNTCPNDQSPMELIEDQASQDQVIGSQSGLGAQVEQSLVFEPETDNDPPKLTGQILSGRYELIEVLGVGGMGTVYRARQTSMNRFVAVKILSPQFSQNPQMIRRFEKEARVVSKLSHPNTVSVFDYGQSGEALYLVMELLEGQTLKEFLKLKGPLRPKVAVHLITQIVRSLHQAHRVGIVHRDIKPANIFVLNINGDNQFAKVLDFGVAKLIQSSTEETVTQAGGIIGTPKYMAPEQAQSMEIDERCDLYSVGVLLFEMLVGTAPYDGDNPIGILMQHAQGAIPALVKPFEAKTSYGQLELIVSRCLQKHPDDRYRNADELLNAIDDWKKVVPTTANTISTPRLSDNRPSDIPSKQHQKRSNKSRTKILIPLFLFALISMGIFWQLEKDTAPTRTIVVKDSTSVSRLPKPTLGIQIEIVSNPPAQLKRLSDGKQMGQTPQSISITESTAFELSQTDFKSKRVELNLDSSTKQSVTLEPVVKRRPSRKKRRTPNKGLGSSRPKASVTAPLKKTMPIKNPSNPPTELEPIEME
jgi:serine/threonine protein kinase